MHRLLTLFLLGMTAIRTLAGEGFVTAGNLRIPYLKQGRGPALPFSAHMVNLEEPQQFDALLEIFFALPGR
jgi:hypothetical protein